MSWQFFFNFLLDSFVIPKTLKYEELKHINAHKFMSF